MTSGILLGTRDKREDSKNFFWNKSASLVGIFLLTCRRFVMSARDQRLFLWFLPITVSFSDIAIFNAIVVQAAGPWRFKTMWDVSHVLNCGKTRVRVAKDSDRTVWSNGGNKIASKVVLQFNVVHFWCSLPSWYKI